MIDRPRDVLQGEPRTLRERIARALDLHAGTIAVMVDCARCATHGTEGDEWCGDCGGLGCIEHPDYATCDPIALLREVLALLSVPSPQSETCATCLKEIASLKAEVARLTAENAALKKEVQEAGEALRLLGVRLYNGAITPDDLAAMLKEAR